MTTTRHSMDDGQQSPRHGALADGSGTDVLPVPGAGRRVVGPSWGPPPGPGIVDLLRRVAVQAETAAVLERRAGSADNPVLAALLHERAAVHRRTALRLRTALAEQMTPARPSSTAGPDRT